MRKLTSDEAALLSRLANDRLLPAEIEPELVKGLEKDGLVRRMLGSWRVTATGALAVMSHAA
jgi:hypothetical protein